MLPLYARVMDVSGQRSAAVAAVGAVIGLLAAEC